MRCRLNEASRGVIATLRGIVGDAGTLESKKARALDWLSPKRAERVSD